MPNPITPIYQSLIPLNPVAYPSPEHHTYLPPYLPSKPILSLGLSICLKIPVLHLPYQSKSPPYQSKLEIAVGLRIQATSSTLCPDESFEDQLIKEQEPLKADEVGSFPDNSFEDKPVSDQELIQLPACVLRNTSLAPLAERPLLALSNIFGHLHHHPHF